jgi:16S rRNA (guanine966-N2)-methyltransferase
VVAGDARAFLRSAATRPDQYSLAFLDPPYAATAGLGRELSLEPVLAAGARIVVESDRRAPLDLPFDLIDERRYGDTLIRIHIRT